MQLGVSDRSTTHQVSNHGGRDGREGERKEGGGREEYRVGREGGKREEGERNMKEGWREREEEGRREKE